MRVSQATLKIHLSIQEFGSRSRQRLGRSTPTALQKRPRSGDLGYAILIPRLDKPFIRMYTVNEYESKTEIHTLLRGVAMFLIRHQVTALVILSALSFNPTSVFGQIRLVFDTVEAWDECDDNQPAEQPLGPIRIELNGLDEIAKKNLEQENEVLDFWIFGDHALVSRRRS
ncbi:MAG: hypothetical protein JWM11_756, partial [Planctomycetaceae bacterium]|nr:hypothetical protein [Planctomycetaceae bacterium]